MVERIDSLVARNSRRWKLLIVSEGLGLLISAVLGYLWTVFLVDNFFYLPMIGRVLKDNLKPEKKPTAKEEEASDDENED